ncbi:hypothetical protein LCGC14_1162690 [marine sediment metagenome]|uniref:Uncharacterized protein n=1 Tax=marine sediment metagenome TaxID=412755 RepID=A0A0F9PAF9_9ZZZZ
MIKECPRCGANPFTPYLRGEIGICGLLPEEYFCALICTVCKTIAEHETKADIEPAETAEDIEKELGYLPSQPTKLTKLNKLNKLNKPLEKWQEEFTEQFIQEFFIPAKELPAKLNKPPITSKRMLDMEFEEFD